MTRPDFTTALYGPLRSRSNTNPNNPWVWVTNCRVTSEDTTGVSRRKPKGRWIDPTAYKLVREEIHCPYGRSWVQVLPGSNWSDFEGYVGRSARFSYSTHFNSAMSDAVADTPLSSNSALIAARAKMKNTRVNLGVAFAERKATSRMVGDTAIRLADAVKAVRRGSFREAARRLGILHDVKKPRGSNWTNHWLQLQYGWKPLLADVYGSCDALAKREQSDWRVTAVARQRDELTQTWVRRPTGTTYPTGGTDACDVVAVRKRGVFIRIDAIPQNDLTMSLASLGVTNPLLIGWELVPYSFVVDWFLPIGNWLNSLDAMLGFGPAWTSTSTWNETTWTDTGFSKDFSPTAWVRNNWFGTKRRLVVNRTVSYGTPLPAFPEFKDPRSLGHMANGLSLLAQAFSR